MSGSCHQLESFLDGTLPGEERAAFEAHLATCASCQAKAKQWSSFARAFKDTTAPLLEAPAPGDVARLMAKVETPRSSWVPRLVAVGALAAVVLAVVLLSRAEPSLEARVDGAVLEGNRVETAEASEKTVDVSGATIVVTPRSTLTLAKRTKKEVRLELETGAVRLQVSHREKDQTFVVRSGEWETFVVGTAFSVVREGQKVMVTVTEGKVRVAAGNTSFEVPAGKTFTAVGLQGAVSDPAPAPVEVVDAGVALVEDVPEPPKLPVKPVVTEAELARWKKLAASGGCATVVLEAGKAVAKVPRSAEAWRALADCQRLTDAKDDAIRSYEKVVTFAKRDEADRARFFIADLLQQRGNHARAIEVLRALLSHAQPAELEAAARMRVARSALSLGDKKNARAELKIITTKLSKTSSALPALELLKSL